MKRKYEKRKQHGCIILAIAFVFGAISYNNYSKSNEFANNLLNNLFKFQKVGGTITKADLESIRVTSELAQIMGRKAERNRTLATSVIGLFIIAISVLFFGMRKDKLLIKYYEKSKN